ncbi:MAG: hypothetical protein AAF808_00575 [Cyanobacteria bacterium P01_D01_bin.2]
MLSNFFKRKETKPAPQPTELWTDVSAEQQESMKGGYPWPGFPPVGGGGGGFANSASGNGKKLGHTIGQGPQ